MQLNTPHRANPCDTAPSNPTKASHAWLTIVLCILLQLAFTNFSYAAGRVFYDGFESGNVSLWDTGGT